MTADEKLAEMTENSESHSRDAFLSSPPWVRFEPTQLFTPLGFPQGTKGAP